MMDSDDSLSALEEDSAGDSADDNSQKQMGARFAFRPANNDGNEDGGEDLDQVEDGDDTADFSSFMALASREKDIRGDDIFSVTTVAAAAAGPATVPGASAGVYETRETDADGGGDDVSGSENSSLGSSWSKRAAAVRPRAPHHSNQKPGRNSEARGRLIAPPATAHMFGGTGGDAAAAAEPGVGPAPGPVRRKPRTAPRRPRRLIDLGPPLTPIDSWRDYAAPTPEAVSWSIR